MFLSTKKKLEILAIELAYDPELRAPSWASCIPPGLTFEESINCLLGLIAIDFCHWGLTSELHVFDFYTENDQGQIVRGSEAVTELLKRAYQQDVKLFEAPFMSAATVDNLRPYFMGFDGAGNEIEIPLLQERVQVMNELGKILLTKWKGSFHHVLLAAKGRALNHGEGFVEILVQDFPRYRDEYLYQGEKVGIYKLAQLSVFALQSALSSKLHPLFSDCHRLTLCADYQIPRCLHAMGILHYHPLLEETIQKQQCIPKDSAFEIELRMATLYVGSLLKDKINAIRLSRSDCVITSQELDYLLWSRGRRLPPENKHHLTITTMY